MLLAGFLNRLIRTGTLTVVDAAGRIYRFGAVLKDGGNIIALTMGNTIMPEKRLLVCDDEAAVGRFVQNATAALGYDVRITTSGEELMRIYDDFQPTIILLDMVIPTWMATK